MVEVPIQPAPNTMPNQVLFVMALDEEGVRLPTTSESLIVGVGKVNAAMRLSAHLAENADRYALVLNLGSAGGVGLTRGSVHRIERCVQFDMDVSALGFERFVTPFDPLENQVIMHTPNALADLPGQVAYTSDRFVAGKSLPPAPAVVDMECYALAKTCALHTIPFAAVKYITDQADAQADTDWTDGLTSCGDALSAVAARLGA